MNHMFGAFTQLLKKVRVTARQIKVMTQSATYHRKYKGLPTNTPVPIIDETGEWDFWEWWWGGGPLSKTCEQEGLRVGPPIGHQSKWCLKLPHHRAELKRLLRKHKPKILFAAPTCGIWSSSNTTMSPELKAAIQAEETETLEFLAECIYIQESDNRSWILEQPKSSEMLRIPLIRKLSLDTNAIDNNLCMCCHELVDPYSHLPCMKPTTLKGSIQLTNRVVRWCPRNHQHQVLQGTMPNGKLRTSQAQTYTKCFCKRLARDLKNFLYPKKAFPVSVESDSEQEQAVVDPYSEDPPDEPEGETPEERAERQIELNKIKRREAAQELPAPVIPVAAPRTPKAVLQPKAKSMPFTKPTAPFRELIDEWDKEEQQQENQQVSTARASTDPPPAVPAGDVVAIPPPAELALAEVQHLDKNRTALIDEIVVFVKDRIANGGRYHIQTGPRLRNLQELFGTPHGKIIVLAAIFKKPAAKVPPEPLASRTVAPLVFELCKRTATQEKWTIEPWKPYAHTVYAKKPYLTVLLYGRNHSEADKLLELETSPWHELAAASSDAKLPLDNLPSFMKTLQSGTPEQKEELILALHRRLYHRSAGEMRALLQRAGVPLSTLASVSSIIEKCQVCRNWARGHAKPVIKVRSAPRFNHTIYGDLVFFTDYTVSLIVDESLRVCSLTVVDSKDVDTCEKVVRRSWINRYGPPKIFRGDFEGAFSSEAFGLFCERYGIERQLVRADDSHSWLGILDRRVQLIRTIIPKLSEEFASEAIRTEPLDIVAECEFALNTLLMYGGYSPYECLYGCNPNPIFHEESEHLGQLGSDSILFFEHAQVRARAIAHFHQALLHTGLARVNTSRPRADDQRTYKVGEWVDVWRKPKNKDAAGWRGPCVVLSLLGEGFLTVRWQGVCFDIPIHHVRPHLTATPLATLNSTGPPVPAIANQPPAAAIENAAPVPAPPPPIEEGATVFIEEQCFWNAIEDPKCFRIHSDVLPSIQSVVMSMKNGHQQIHAVTLHDKKLVQSPAMIQDGSAIFNLGRQLAAERKIDNYQGLILSVGRSVLPVLEGVKSNHVLSWTGDTTSQLIESTHSKIVNWEQHGVEPASLRNHHVIAILESHPTGGETLTDMLQKSKLVHEEEDFGPSRVRFKEPIEIAVPIDNDNLSVSESSRRLSDFDTPSVSEDLALFLKSEKTLNDSIGYRLRHSMSEQLQSTEEPLHENEQSFSSSHCFAADESDFEYFTPNDGTDWYYIDGDSFHLLTDDESERSFPVDRATRPVSKAELSSRYQEIRAARKKELQSWIDNKTGKAQLRSEWETSTGRRAIPSRWVDTWKLKSGVLIAKSRLCLKGFAEPITPEETNASPTANRVSHRLVCHTAVQRKWTLASLDVSVAFLKGFTFTELAEKGMSRKPVAFQPCEDVWDILCELSPSEFNHVKERPKDYIFVLEKAAYGLRDAPLLWHLRAVEVLRECGYKPLLHDGCTFALREGASQEVTALLTLHVDDLLLAAPMHNVLKLQTALSKVFGTLTLDLGTNGFKHFGVDIHQDASLCFVTASQEKYIADLKPIELPNRCLKTAECGPEKTTEYRALVSAVAWVGVTSPFALASASLLQGCLPNPTWGDIVKLNTNLAELKTMYCPLQYHPLVEPLRIISVSDSSFANSGKYSQNGFLSLLCSADDNELCGQFCLLDFKSNKSKRVATSTLHAEALGSINGLEASTYLQSYLLELSKPNLNAMQLLTPETHDELIPIIAVTDCNDLQDTLIAPAQPASTTKHLALYIAAIREHRATGRVSAFVWIDTRDMLSNSLTKLKEDGTCEKELLPSLQTFVWKLQHAYKWNNTWCAE